MDFKKELLKVALLNNGNNPNWPPKDFKSIINNVNNNNINADKKKIFNNTKKNKSDFIKNVSEKLNNRKKVNNNNTAINSEVSANNPIDVEKGFNINKGILGAGIGGLTGTGLGHLYDKRQKDEDSKRGKIIGGLTGAGIGTGVGYLLSKKASRRNDIPIKEFIKNNPELADEIKNNPTKIDEIVKNAKNKIPSESNNFNHPKSTLLGAGIGGLTGTGFGHFYDKRQKNKNSKRGKIIGGLIGAGIGTGVGYLMNKKASVKYILGSLIKKASINDLSFEEKEKLETELTPEAKKDIKRDLLSAYIPHFGMTGAGLGAGINAGLNKNINKGMLLGGVGGSLLGAGTALGINKLTQKALKKGIKDKKHPGNQIDVRKAILKSNINSSEKPVSKKILNNLLLGGGGAVIGIQAGKNLAEAASMGGGLYRENQGIKGFNKAFENFMERKENSININKKASINDLAKLPVSNEIAYMMKNRTSDYSVDDADKSLNLKRLIEKYKSN